MPPVEWHHPARGAGGGGPAGPPPCPVTFIWMVCPGPIGLPPRRVSRIRFGLTPVKISPDAVLVVPSVNQPLTSATRSTLPAALKRLALPPVPTLTITRFGTVWWATKLRLDAPG